MEVCTKKLFIAGFCTTKHLCHLPQGFEAAWTTHSRHNHFCHGGFFHTCCAKHHHRDWWQKGAEGPATGGENPMISPNVSSSVSKLIGSVEFSTARRIACPAPGRFFACLWVFQCSERLGELLPGEHMLNLCSKIGGFKAPSSVLNTGPRRIGGRRHPKAILLGLGLLQLLHHLLRGLGPRLPRLPRLHGLNMKQWMGCSSFRAIHAIMRL